MSKERKQPVGVTIIGIFGIIVGIISLFGGIGILTLGSLVNEFVPNNLTNSSNSFGMSDLNGTSSNDDDIIWTEEELAQFNSNFSFIYYLGMFLIPYGIAVIVFAWGLLRGKGWAWLGAVILIIVDIIMGIILQFTVPTDTFGIVASIVIFIIDGVILWYLFRSHVKTYFGVSSSH